MTMSVKAEPQKTAGPQECAGCGKKIQDRFLLKALDMFWHEDCLKCGCCDCRLGEVGSTLYTKGNLILCKRDYLRLFGTTGYCAACNKVIPAFEMVMRARTNVYHLECFACQQCNHRFCVGDRFFLCDNKILCEYDYEERMVFANLAYNSNNLAQLKQQARSINGQQQPPMGKDQSPMNGGCPPPSMGPHCSPMNGMGPGGPGMSHHHQMNGHHPMHGGHLNGGGPGLMSHSLGGPHMPMGPPDSMMGGGPRMPMNPCGSSSMAGGSSGSNGGNSCGMGTSVSPATSTSSSSSSVVPLPPMSAPPGPLTSLVS